MRAWEQTVDQHIEWAEHSIEQRVLSIEVELENCLAATLVRLATIQANLKQGNRATKHRWRRAKRIEMKHIGSFDPQATLLLENKLGSVWIPYIFLGCPLRDYWESKLVGLCRQSRALVMCDLDGQNRTEIDLAVAVDPTLWIVDSSIADGHIAVLGKTLFQRGLWYVADLGMTRSYSEYLNHSCEQYAIATADSFVYLVHYSFIQKLTCQGQVVWRIDHHEPTIWKCVASAFDLFVAINDEWYIYNIYNGSRRRWCCLDLWPEHALITRWSMAIICFANEAIIESHSWVYNKEFGGRLDIPITGIAWIGDKWLVQRY